MNKPSKRITIPDEQLKFEFSTSSGPGGQNVNKLSTKVAVLFDIQNTKTLTNEQKIYLCNKLSKKINKKGMIRIVSQKFRTQTANRKAAIEKLYELLNTALKKPNKRKKTKIPLKAKLKRLEDKKKRSLIKKSRTESRNIDY